MPLPWIRLDTAMPDHPKIIELVDHHGDAGMAAAFVWVCSLAYSGKHGTDGFLTKNVLARLNGKVKHARLLTEVGLWKDEGIGWTINGWAEYQESNEETQKRSERGRLAALKRWHPEEFDA
jgi:hypothetical protein